MKEVKMEVGGIEAAALLAFLEASDLTMEDFIQTSITMVTHYPMEWIAFAEKSVKRHMEVIEEIQQMQQSVERRMMN